MTTIAFHSNQLSLQGTEVALYDYAHFSETLLGHRSVVVYDQSSPHNHPAALQKFANRFTVLGYTQRSELDGLLTRHDVDMLYAIKSGKRDGLISQVVPTMVHAVFPTSLSQVHGSAYAYISEWLSWHCSHQRVPCVPHIVHLPAVSGDLRDTLGIPADALVVGLPEYNFGIAPMAKNALDWATRPPHDRAISGTVVAFTSDADHTGHQP